VIAQAYSDLEEETEAGSAVSVPLTLKELVAIRAEIIESWREIGKVKARMEEAFSRIHDKAFSFEHPDRQHYRYDSDGYPFAFESQVQALDYSLWRFALEKLNITNAMTGSARDEFLAKVKERKTEFSEKEIQGLAQNASRLFKESSVNTVREVYRKLIGMRYRSGEAALAYKKDNLQKVEKVFRMGWCDVRYDPTWGRIGVDYNRNNPGCFHFDDLITACRLIEGKGFADYSNNIWAMVCAEENRQRGNMELDTDYFTIRVYKNGNVKVHWREDKMDVLAHPPSRQ
jgi:hypothetical protein